MESREEIISEIAEIAKGLSVFGTLKLRWIARHLQGLDEKEKRRLLCAGREMLGPQKGEVMQ